MATSAQHSDSDSNSNSMGLSTHAAKAAALPLPLRLRRARPTPAATLTTATATATATANDHDFASTKNVVVLGGSYAGMHAATVLAQKLPPTHRVVLVDRNSHFNHLYVFPRFSVLPGHEQKAFIPYTSIFSKAPSRARHDPSDSAATASTSQPTLRATTATAPTFDLEMGSTAGATREQSATLATTAVTTTATSSSSLASSEPSSSSSSTSSFSLSSPIDDEGTYPDSSASSLLFDRASSSRVQDPHPKGPHSTRSLASTLSSLYASSSSRASADGHAVGEHESLADKLNAQLRVASKEEEGASKDVELVADQTRPIHAQSVTGAKVEFGTDDGQTLHVHEEVTPSEAVHEQEALGRQPMRVQTSSSSVDQQQEEEATPCCDDQSAFAKEEEREQEEGGANSYEGAPPHVFLQATVTDIKPDHVLVEVSPNNNNNKSSSSSSSSTQPLWNITSRSLQISYTHLIYALGSHLPDPLRTDAHTKSQGMNWMQDVQRRVAEAEDIVLVGGGALGVQFASDIASVHGTVSAEAHPSCSSSSSVGKGGKKKKKRVTLIHSRQRLLPNFDERIHEIALKRLTELGVDVVLGERLALTDGCPRGSATVEDRVALPRSVGAGAEGSSSSSSAARWSVDEPPSSDQKKSSELLDVRHASAAELSTAASRPNRKLVRTTAGKLFHADVLLLCTGQQPNSALLAKLSPGSVDPRTRLVKVRRTLQVERGQGWVGGVVEAKAPCGDCDCFIDRKVDAASQHQHPEHPEGAQCDCGSMSLGGENAEEEVEDRTRCWGNVYAIGDVADAFGALNAGYQAWAMADVAAENVLRDLDVLGPGGVDLPLSSTEEQKEAGPPKVMRRFKPVAPMLKLSLGLGTMAWQGAPVPHRLPRRRTTATTPSATAASQARTRSGTISGGSTTPTLSSSSCLTPDATQEGEEEEEEEEEMVMKPEVMEKEDPFDLGVEGVWKFMANADTEDLYL